MTVIKTLWNKAARLAREHRDATAKMHILCQEVYGFQFDDMESLADEDRIIDTIDNGTDYLSFDEFDKLMKAACKEFNEDMAYPEPPY